MNRLLAKFFVMFFVASSAFAQGQQTNGRFEEFEIVFPQAGENVVAQMEEIKAAIVYIISPASKADDPALVQKRANELSDAYHKAPKRYTDQLNVVEDHFFKLTGKHVKDIVAPKEKFDRSEVIRITNKNDVDSPGDWKVFDHFRDDPVGEAIDPNGTHEEVVARVAKFRKNAIAQVMRTTYDPFVKVEWVEKLNACLDGKRGEEAGWCEVVVIREWSLLWEYTSGKTSSVEKVEFLPKPEYKDAKGLALFLNRSGADVLHAFPCGLNPCVAFGQIKFRQDRNVEVPKAAPPPPASCVVLQTPPGTKIDALGRVELLPTQTVTFTAVLQGLTDLHQVILEQFLVDGTPRLGGQRSFTFSPADYNFRLGAHDVSYLMRDQFGNQSVCPTRVVNIVAPPAPPPPAVTKVIPPPTRTPDEPKVRRPGNGKKWLILAGVIGGAVAACAIAGCFGGKDKTVQPEKPWTPPVLTAAPATPAVGFSISFGGRQ
jgi:hypothetical protein